jgi:3-phenylpropionate/trans-cinnamate dioxygenase ferredoxin reductase subunit
MAEQSSPTGLDFAQGVALADLDATGKVTGHVGGEPALLIRQGGELFAIGAKCTHYGGPLADGLAVGETIRCPWHHACFSLRTGEVLHAPALDGLKCWHVEERDGRIFVGDALPAKEPPKPSFPDLPASVVIVGGGAAGNAAAMTLRQEGYQGAVTMISADSSRPYDRPNLSKDYLAGTAKAAWLPLRSQKFYANRAIDLRLDSPVTALDAEKRTVTLADGSAMHYGALLLATGAEPNRLDVPGADLPHVHTLRTLADCDALIASLGTAKRCVVVGAGFIGLETAASLQARGLDVHVVAPDERPMQRILGPQLAAMMREIHESHGVVFHLGTTVASIKPDHVSLTTGADLPADLVIVGIGVHPELTLAQQAGLAIDHGVTVDAFLRTSDPHIFAAGDIARWPDARTGNRIRVEHWVVAQRQGVIAARNMLGQRQAFDAVPFFWTQHYDTSINYVGHAENWDRVEIKGDPAKRDCSATYWQGSKRLAVVTVGRDLDSLSVEAEFERETVA